MAFLAGLNDYLIKSYPNSALDEAVASQGLYCLHLHGGTSIQGNITANATYDIEITTPDGDRRDLPKIQIKMLYPAEYAQPVQAHITIDEALQTQGLGPIVAVKQRNFIKNKTLFVLMREQEEVSCTLLEGEILQGCIHSFSRYEITLRITEQETVVVLRHAILDIRNKQDRCFLKASQQTLRDWIKSSLYIDPRPRSQLRPGLKKSKIKRRRKVIIR
jgi:sRNA-binding regulator protein Hfq